MINLFQPNLGDAEIEAIREVFTSNWLGPGVRAQAFERKFAEYIGRPPSELITVSNCTEGLFQAVTALGLGPGDDVIFPSVGFVGAAHAVRNSGARVVLCDVDSTTLNPRIEHFEHAITEKTRAAIILHYGGYPGDVVELSKFAEARSISMIEDAACALGSFTMEKACGTFGEVGAWSFDSMKMLVTGDGGMVWAKRQLIADKIRAGIRLGVESSGFHRRTRSAQWWEINPVMIGRRGTMNDIAAAVGLVQLDRLPGFLCQRAEVAARYDAELSDLVWLRLPPRAPARAARTFYWVQTAPETRDRLALYLLQHEIYTSFRYWPLHKTRMYQSHRAFPGADLAAASTLLLPLHQGLSTTDVSRVIDAVRRFPA
ncbi:MAG: DegT/DnrJ/EryC1/StrS family aminotransferase [Candidatus Eisenbacteria bacterium]|uniref:DegT/DnrJ/EryC1/StrS family aminotransferase n=1 Tax=Eiseniibacteriota bacterium TaxID=2212470 RepID=A0A948W520_UNCEI|nr:DegT/DnrJ/EryC1/StrS family aminotransferase [Candidatus Eisenbacteria bacterium]MBU2689934.1 DegT/DnrJ/EryC1/StrS family aminotransferase [Candidatus Eisenbacteria bacterium]